MYLLSWVLRCLNHKQIEQESCDGNKYGGVSGKKELGDQEHRSIAPDSWNPTEVNYTDFYPLVD